jgi:hypothetical protein
LGTNALYNQIGFFGLMIRRKDNFRNFVTGKAFSFLTNSAMKMQMQVSFYFTFTTIFT